MAPARRMTRSNREVYPLMFLFFHVSSTPLLIIAISFFLIPFSNSAYILLLKMQPSQSPNSLVAQFKQNLPKTHQIFTYPNCKYTG